MTKNWLIALIVAFGLGYGINVYMDSQADEEKAQQIAASQQIANDPIFIGKDNRPVRIFEPTDDRIRIVYFGYTRCPDVCPTSLAMLSAALREFDDKQLAKLRPLFISIDPERDDPVAAHQYAQYFHPTISGLSAPLTTTQPVADRYGVIFRKTELKESAIDYVVDHSSYFYFLQPDGSLITKVPHTLDPEPIVQAINSVLAN
ncbi:photosynthetic protein synthase I [Vibrio sp. MACH09]|uniref:SCO family protein n=1 Tax=unclassified Vibrio TaxID=2614977 RepID=UPI001493AE40|nr:MULTISPECIES: SCO family protein [unclassified Vibrio]NOI64641.1 SCO family protein [Vibrio sp. 99-8-1]GLO63155.1 photosynthetic protein synthase I [Vibrio sp. MACH09]